MDPAEVVAEDVVERPKRTYAARWKHASLLTGGYLVVPTTFLKHYSSLEPYPLTSGEALFVLQLMAFKWDADAPFPGYKTLAHRLGISDKMARRHAQSLETKGYLRREIRTGKTNRFDLTPLFDKLNEVHAADVKTAKAKSRRRAPGAANLDDFDPF